MIGPMPGQMPRQRTASERKASEGTASEGTASEGTASDGETYEGKTSEGKTSEAKTNEGKTSGRMTSDGETYGAKTNEAKTSGRITNPAPCPPKQDDDTARFPNARLRSWINARDTTCRAPGCTAPARSCDTDHTRDHADGGRTTHNNLGLLCRHHHRLKHEGGFHLHQPEPGHFTWTSPTGRTYETLPEPP